MHRSGKQKKLLRIMMGLIIQLLLNSAPSPASHPLITDDTCTQGKEKFLLELNSEYGTDKEIRQELPVETREGATAVLFSAGVTDTADLVFGLPYLWSRVRENHELTSDEEGFSDFSMEVKWRFWETEGFSLALKPGVTFPSGNDEKGLGKGRVAGSLYLISTAVTGPWAFHFNAGYLRNENKLDERKDLWHFSLAAEREVLKGLRLVGNIGAERNPEKDSSRHPTFILGGVIYSLLENLDIDLGVKAGLTSAETALAFLLGLAFRF